ncbi:MAG: choice-of-anchor P family protein [Pyrinomonadaceae bacterium]
MKKGNRMFMLLTIAAIMCLFGLTPIQAQTATSFSGHATGVIANATVAGIGTVNARAGDTPTLPPQGSAELNGDVARASIQVTGNGINNRLQTDAIVTRTSGGTAAGTPNSSQSRATVNNLDLRLFDSAIRITADTVQSSSTCTCGANPTCSGATIIQNLQVNSVLIPILDASGNAIVNPAPNTTILPAITGVAGLTIILNEQIRNGSGDITVNALRITLRDPVTNVVTVNIIVAQSHSDITCAAVTAGSADLQIAKTCVNGNNNVITCTITVTNNGPDAAANIVVRDVLPTNTVFVSASQTGGFTLTTPVVGATGGTVTGSLATLASMQTATLTVVSNVARGTPVGTSISNTATVMSTTADPTPGNNSTTATFTTVVPTAASFSGQATGVIANATIGNVVATNVRVAETGPLPTTGGSLINGGLADIRLGTNNTLTTGVISTRTSGGPAGIVDGGTANTSQSQAVVNNLILNLDLLADINITGENVTANTNCQCTNNGPSCAGTSLIKNLRVNGTLIVQEGVGLDINGNAFLMAPANTRLVTPDGTITLILNEQIFNGSGNITVNALRIIVNVPGAATTDIIVAQAHSDIQCLLGATAASATISGRVLTPKGRGLPRVTVILTAPNGDVMYTVTNPRGYYSFADLEVGGNYLLSVRSKRYIFATQSIFVTEDLADIDFTPMQ